MNIHESSNGNQSAVSFDKLQIEGKALTKAIDDAERKGDSKQVEHLFSQKAKLVRRLKEFNACKRGQYQ